MKLLERPADRAALMLVLATLFWGLSFPLNKRWQDIAVGEIEWSVGLSSTTLVGLRVTGSLILFALFQPRLVFSPTAREHLTGFWIGVLNWAAFLLQVMAINDTTPALSSFLTSLASVWGPILGWLVFRTPVGLPLAVGLSLGMIGAGVLSIESGAHWSIGRGEALTLVSSMIFGVVIVVLDREGKKLRSSHLTVGFLFGNWLPAMLLCFGLAGMEQGHRDWIQETVELMTRGPVFRDVAVSTILCSVLASHLFMTYQPRLSAARAALIYLLEPVFASAFSLAFGEDELTGRLLLGGGFILIGNFLVEVPRLWREFRAPA